MDPRAEDPDRDEAAEELASFDGLAPTRRALSQFLMTYKFAIDEVTTKLDILREEFTLLHDYNPIEHITSRLKSPHDIVAKARRKGSPLEIGSVKEHIRDIAGVRVVCSFESDVYVLFEILTQQSDVTVVEVKDYISDPKPNGYRSLHALVQIPVFLSSGPEVVDVELQLRTVAMDFWASLEHKIFYKYERHVPEHLVEELEEAARVAAQLDQRMQHLHREINALEP